MKTIYVIFIACIIISCKKENDNPSNETSALKDICICSINNKSHTIEGINSRGIHKYGNKDTLVIAYTFSLGSSFQICEDSSDLSYENIQFSFMKKFLTSNLKGQFDTNSITGYTPTIKEKLNILNSAGANNQFYTDIYGGYWFINEGIKVSLYACDGSHLGNWHSNGEEYKYAVVDYCPESYQDDSFFNIESFEYIDSIDMYYLSAYFHVTLYKIHDMNIVDSLVINNGQLKMSVGKEYTTLDI